ncbi:NAD(P)/FAD-dependent oxidoreductase [Reichenbachiella sp. MALMAid0571]|uniref:NAD(P)/FAD-dependent oxidoreductase n=1 Tax=Reichenbachiella sp. MALMAid0571 TaxID=3143939 RepID=UPI0032DE6043
MAKKKNDDAMTGNKKMDVIIIGGSYAGLSAAMALGRSLRNVLVIDSGNPCNQRTPHSHNFITHDGHTPKQISAEAREQVERYDTVKFHQGFAKNVTKLQYGFEVETQEESVFFSKKIIFATGLKDIMPDIKGFAECWAISVIHCPYCHGYEVRSEKTGIIANGEKAFHYARLISNWTKELSLFTNGKSTLTPEQTVKLRQNNITIVETEVEEIQHQNGKVESVIFKDATTISLKAIYSGPEFVQHSDIPERLGCEMTEHGLIKVDEAQKTTVSGVFACGDNSKFRVVSLAVSSGTIAGVSANFELIDEMF